MCGRLETEALTVVAVIVYEDNFFDEVGRTLLQNTEARGSGVKWVLLHESFTLCTLNKVITLNVISRSKTGNDEECSAVFHLCMWSAL